MLDGSDYLSGHLREALVKWLAKKSIEAVWTLLSGYFQPNRLLKEINAALQADEKIAILIKPAPKLVKDRLTTDAIRELLHKTVSQNSDAIADYLLNEQIIALPYQPSQKPNSYAPVWKCIGDTVMGVLANAVATDESLTRQFSLFAQQAGQQQHKQVVEELQALNAHNTAQSSLLHEIHDIVKASSETHPNAISTRAQMKVVDLLVAQNDELETQLKDQLSEYANRLWTGILDDIRNRDYRKAVETGRKLSEWLDDGGQSASKDVQGRTCLLLAQIALIESSEYCENSNNHESARNFLERATQHLDGGAEENQSKLRNFRARLLSLDGHVDEAVEMLRHCDDSQSVYTLLVILRDQGQYEKAASIVEDRIIDRQWCDHAAFIYARLGDDASRDRILKWSQQSENLSNDIQCSVAAAHGTLLKLNASQPYGITVLSMTPADKLCVTAITEILARHVEPCLSGKPVVSGIEADAIGHAYTCFCLMGNIEKAITVAQLLKYYRPVHVDFAHAVLRGHVAADAALSGQIREDYPTTLDILEVALTLDLQANLPPIRLLSVANELELLAKTQEQREQLGRLVFQIATNIEPEETGLSRDLMVKLLGEGHSLAALLDAHVALKLANHDRAEQILATLDSDNNFLVAQFVAQLRIAQKQPIDAATILARVGEQICEPELLLNSAELALRAKPRNLPLALSSLEIAIQIAPEDLRVNRTLAYCYAEVSAFISAAECFRRMRIAEPENQFHTLNLAQALVLSNQPVEALECYSDLCELPDSMVDAHLNRASLLKDIGQPQKAFDELAAIRERFWETPEFVLAYMDIAYSSNQEKRAHEAFQQMWSLRQSGVAPEDMLQPKSIDDLIELGNETRERRKFLLEQTIAGKLPWLFLESLVNNVPYWGWRVRTQTMSWFFDSPHNRASYGIYSTNSYAIGEVEGRRSFVRRESSEKNSSVVADLSALITLHRLGLLTHAIDFFDRILIPPAYLGSVIRETGRLRPHQLSQKMSLETIDSTIASGDLTILETNHEFQGDTVDEYGDEGEENLYRLRDLLKALMAAGRISQRQLDDASLASYKDARPENERHLRLTVPIRCGYLTLQQLAEQSLLGTVCSAFDDVRISINDQAQLVRELDGFRQLAETQLWHDELWEILSKSNRVTATTILLRPESASESESADAPFADLDAALLAQQEHIPLLADDRVCQQIVLHSDQPTQTAFGTDCLIVKLLEAGCIDEEQAARAYLQLVDWRYRFLIVPSSIMKVIATKFAANDLRRVAWYLHDCMSDPGLPGGLEATEPPLPIAFRFFQDWLKVIGDFVAELWLDDTVPDDQRLTLTSWTVAEMVPTCPQVLGFTARVAELTAFTVLHHACVRLCETPDYPTANAVLRTIAVGFGLSDKDFNRIASDILNSHADTASDDSEVRVFLSRMFRHLFDHLTGTMMDARTVMVAIRCGVFKSIPLTPMPTGALKALEDPKSRPGSAHCYGPGVLYSDGPAAIGVFDIDVAFLNSEVRIRQLAFSEVDRQVRLHSAKSALFLSPNASNRIGELQTTATCADLHIGLKASIEFNDILKGDYFYQLSGLRQSLELGMNSDLSRYSNVLTPTESMIRFLLEHPVSMPNREPNDIEITRSRVVADSNSLPELLNNYFKYFGHLPLTGRASAAGVVDSWLEENESSDPIDAIFEWAKGGSCLGSYHACQVLLQHAEWLDNDARDALFRAVDEILTDGANRWRLRCDLARHYCRHLHSLAPGPDSERIATFSWWLAEYLADVIEKIPNAATMMAPIIEAAIKISEEVSSAVRSPSVPSHLRHATECTRSMWATSIIAEISNSNLVSLLDSQNPILANLENCIANPTFCSVHRTGAEDPVYSFELPFNVLAERISEFRPKKQKSIQTLAILDFARVDDGMNELLAKLPESTDSVAQLVAHELRLQASCGWSTADQLLKKFYDEDWRKWLTEFSHTSAVEMMVTGAIEIALRDDNHESRMYLPHFFAVASEETEVEERQTHLFACTVVASLATDSTSAVRRVLTGKHRRKYGEAVEYWNTHLSQLTPHAPAWIAARMRCMRAALFIG